MFAFRISLITTLLLPVLVNAASPVTLAQVEMQQPVRELMINGTLSADQSSRLSASVAGLVSKVQVDIGDAVAAGDVLLELDSELNRLALQQAQASRRQQQSMLNDAQRRLEEASSLIARRSIAASEVRSLESEVEAATAAMAASHADVARQQALLDRHKLTAPFAGVISAKLTEAGEWVSPGMAVFELVGSDDLHADFAVPQRYFSQISLATPLTVRLENADKNGQNAPIPAEITAIVPVSDPAARTFVIRASVPAEGLTPGMSVFGALAIQSSARETVIPRDALLRDAQGIVSVWLAEDADGGPVARRKVIRIRPGQSDPVIVTEGLQPGDRVVVRGNESLRDGDPIQVAR